MSRSRISRRKFIRGVGAGIALGSVLGGIELMRPTRVYARVTIKPKTHEQEQSVNGEEVYLLPFAATHAALHWTGHHDAAVTAAFSMDGITFGPPVPVVHDEIGEQRNDGRTYGAVMLTGGAVAVKVTSDRSHAIRLLGMAGGEREGTYETANNKASGTTMPPVTSRAGWGCNESYMNWTPEFYPVQKLICHHTATTNNDPDPAATVRSIYYYHAVTQTWGDIGYNFLVDEKGTIYEGRYSGSTTGENATGQGVTGAHAYQFNAGTVGIAFLGTLTNQN